MSSFSRNFKKFFSSQFKKSHIHYEALKTSDSSKGDEDEELGDNTRVGEKERIERIKVNS